MLWPRFEVERLWRTVKYEGVYLKAYSNRREAKDGLEAYFHFYNTQRPHRALGYRTPAEVFNGDLVQSTEKTAERGEFPGKALVRLGSGCWAAMTRMMGVPDYEFVVAQHPLSSLTDDECQEKAESLVDDVERILLGSNTSPSA